MIRKESIILNGSRKQRQRIACGREEIRKELCCYFVAYAAFL